MVHPPVLRLMPIDFFVHTTYVARVNISFLIRSYIHASAGEGTPPETLSEGPAGGTLPEAFLYATWIYYCCSAKKNTLVLGPRFKGKSIRVVGCPSKIRKKRTECTTVQDGSAEPKPSVVEAASSITLTISLPLPSFVCFAVPRSLISAPRIRIGFYY